MCTELQKSQVTDFTQCYTRNTIRKSIFKSHSRGWRCFRRNQNDKKNL